MRDEIDDMPQDDPDRESAGGAPLRITAADDDEPYDLPPAEPAEPVDVEAEPGDDDREPAAGLPTVPGEAEPAEAHPLPGERAGERSFGTWLRRQREMRDIDLREIADKTKISLRYLKAMEQDRFELLPAPLFARGFLREYAKYVGLNADEVVNYYLSAHEGAGEDDELDRTRDRRRFSGTSSSGPATKGALLVLVLIVVVALGAYFLFWRQSREGASAGARPPIAAPPAVEVPESTVPPPAPDAESTAPIVVTLDFTQQCWVEAAVDGEPTLSRLFVAGESSQLEAQTSVTLESIGNAGGVEVQVNGVPFDLGAGEGETVHGVTIDLGTVQRLRRRAG